MWAPSYRIEMALASSIILGGGNGSIMLSVMLRVSENPLRVVVGLRELIRH